VILSGGPASVTEAARPARRRRSSTGVPVLGICYGEQTMAAQLGGEVEGGHHREFGRADVEIVAIPAPLFDGVWEVGQRYQVWMSHGDRVTKLPDGLPSSRSRERAPSRRSATRRGASTACSSTPKSCTRPTARG
jgi:GMP synthase (glutamine-hydrolysing)